MESKTEDPDSKVAEYLEKIDLSSRKEKDEDDLSDPQDENSEDESE